MGMTPQEMLVPVHDGDVRIMADNGSQRHRLGVLIRLHFDWRVPPKCRKRLGLVGNKNAVDRHLAYKPMQAVHKIDMPNFVPRS